MKKYIKLNSQGEINKSDLLDFLDIDKVKYYSCEEKDGKIILIFYDKDKNVIKLKEN